MEKEIIDVLALTPQNIEMAIKIAKTTEKAKREFWCAWPVLSPRGKNVTKFWLEKNCVISEREKNLDKKNEA